MYRAIGIRASRALGKTLGKEGNGRGFSLSSLPLRDNVEALLKFTSFVVQIFSELFRGPHAHVVMTEIPGRLTKEELTQDLNTPRIDANHFSLNVRAIL